MQRIVSPGKLLHSSTRQEILSAVFTIDHKPPTLMEYGDRYGEFQASPTHWPLSAENILLVLEDGREGRVVVRPGPPGSIDARLVTFSFEGSGPLVVPMA